MNSPVSYKFKTGQNFIPPLRFKRLTGFYDHLIAATMPEKAFKTALVRQAGLRPGHRVLDFGTGTATLSIMAKEMQTSAQITGIDIDAKVLAIARTKIARAGIDIQLVQYSGGVLPFAANSFDRVISCLVFHHLTDLQKLNALIEIRKVLDRRGELHIADWGKPFNGMMRLLFYLVQLLDGFTTTNDSVRGKLPEYIRQAGFSVAEETGMFNTVFGTLRLWSCMKTVS